MAYKHDYDKTLTRLNTIIARLNSAESLSVKDLAQEFNVSQRTIQRDFNERLISLYPIYQDKRLWKMQEGHKIEKSVDVQETIVLDILEKLTDGLGSEFSAKAKHLLSKIKNSDFNPIYAKLNMEDISDKLSLIVKLENAIKAKVTIGCEYLLGGDVKNIELKPLKIANFEGFWYLIALDARSDALKKYHLKSISNIELLQATFTVTKELDELLQNAISVWFDNKTEPFEVELFLFPEAAKRLKRKPIGKTQHLLKEYADGSSEISIKVTHAMEILPIIKYWMPHITVLSPDWLGEQLIEDSKLFLEKQGKSKQT